MSAPALRDALQYMLDRRQILDARTLAPKVTPLVRIPPNGGEMNQWVAKQVLDLGVFGIIFPHVSTVEEARNAIGACSISKATPSRFELDIAVAVSMSTDANPTNATFPCSMAPMTPFSRGMSGMLGSYAGSFMRV